MKLPKEIRNNKYILDGLIIKMRYQNIDPLNNKNIACMSYGSISNLVGRSITYCRDVCTDFIK